MSLRIVAVVGIALLAAACSTSSRSGREDDNDPIRALLSADALVFTSFDRDNDLTVTTAEMEAGLNTEFARADANRDGTLQPIEFQTWGNTALGGGYVGPYRLDFDRNVDNAITRAEFDTEFRARFDTYDDDDNGAVTRADFVRRIGQARPVRTQQRTYGTPSGQ